MYMVILVIINYYNDNDYDDDDDDFTCGVLKFMASDEVTKWLRNSGSADAFISSVVHDPIQVVGHSGVHSWIVFPCTSFAPRHDSCAKVYTL